MSDFIFKKTVQFSLWLGAPITTKQAGIQVQEY